ncbi:ribosome silencing factor [Nibricoccus sp. IMCC34717]|uniref:ribosome silencing factor n=1 Tax=Nibricoccus sp. IMCC34717 TaxID=3034021 RepID=UPI00384C23C2
MTQAQPIDTATLLRLVCRALDEKKAENVRVLRVGELSSITDYLVLATGTSEPHLRALRVELEKVIDATGTRILGMDTGTESGWMVIDAFDVMIHILTPENRGRYAIEALWGDADELPLAEVLSDKPAEPVKAAKQPKAPSAAGAKAPKKAKPAKKVSAKAPKKAAAKPAAKVAKRAAKPAKKAAPAKKPSAASELLRKAAARLSKKR